LNAKKPLKFPLRALYILALTKNFVAERKGFEYAPYLCIIIGVKIFLKNVVRSGVRVGEKAIF
jgi:hypothetical protein